MSSSHPALRQPILVVLGHVDSGKCVSGDTLIQLSDGRLIEARRAFELFGSGDPKLVPDGVVCDASGMQVLSVGAEGKVSPRRVSHVWKLHADRMVRVQTRAGYAVETTPEHKFMVMTPKGGASYLEAKNLAVGDFLVIPNRSPIVQRAPEEIKRSILEGISDDFLVRPAASINGEFSHLARGRTRKLGEQVGDKILDFHLSKGYYRASVYRNLLSRVGIAAHVGYDGIEAIKYSSKKKRASHLSPWVGLPKTRSQFSDLLYLLGLLYGDGLAKSCDLSSNSPSIISEYRSCMLATFGVQSRRAWRRTSFIVSHRGGKSVAKFFADVFGYPQTDKPRVLNAPEIVTTMPDEFISSFLRGFFDAEGFVQTGRNIGVGCASAKLMNQLPILLSRFGCLAYFGKTHNHEIFISGRSNVSSFLDNIGFREKKKMEAAIEMLGHSETNRAFELTPVPGSFTKQVRQGRKVAWDRHLQISSYERDAHISEGFLVRMFEAVPSYRYDELEQLVSNCSMVEVTGIKSKQGQFTVYDFTVDDTHNFLANGLVVHNTSLLDRMRGTAVQAREAGGITQEIGASYFPLETLQQICGPLLSRAGGELQIPGLLVIDTPGHEVFSNLRLRGGSAADIAIVVVDVMKGLENQTLESIDILKQRRVPFVVALNKIDMIGGWRKEAHGALIQVMKEQSPEWNDEFEERLYNVVGGLSRLGFQSDAYYRVKDFRQQVSIVPVSARQGQGIPELLAMLIGLAQQFLKNRLVAIDETHGARGIILELQEESGIGQTANVILTEGALRIGDSIVLVDRNGAIKSRVKALFMPKPLDEMRDPRDKFTVVEAVYAAAGVKLVSPDLAGVVAGTSVATFANDSDFERLRMEMEKELRNVVVKTDNMGVIVKAGNVGGLEALLRMLEEKGIPVRQADIGDISRSDIVDANLVGEHDPYLAAILAFDVKVLQDAKESVGDTPLFISKVIYEVIDNYVDWAARKREEDERAALSNITPPCKLKALPGNFFRRNDPAVFGVEILAGKLRPKVRLIGSSGQELGTIEQIQDKGKSLPQVKIGDKVAISVKGPTLGRQIKENDVIFTFPKSHEVKLLRSKFLSSLSQDDLEALSEIVEIVSVVDPLYGF